MEDIFFILDLDGSGTITQAEIEALFQNINDDKVKSEIKDLLSQGDLDGDNEYTLEKFTTIFDKWKQKGLSSDYILDYLQ